MMPSISPIQPPIPNVQHVIAIWMRPSVVLPIMNLCTPSEPITIAMIPIVVRCGASAGMSAIEECSGLRLRVEGKDLSPVLRVPEQFSDPRRGQQDCPGVQPTVG